MLYSKRPLLAAVLYLFSSVHSAYSQTNVEKPESVVPVIQTVEWAQSWWMPRHEAKLAEAKKRSEEIELVFIGDSITHHFDKGVWAENFEQYGAFNLGFSGDETQHVLWRFENGALDHLDPKLAIIMIGTNNTGNSSHEPSDTALGIDAVVRETKAQLPKSKMLLLGIFPRGIEKDHPMRKTNKAINNKLPAIAEKHGIDYLDIGHIFLDKKGRLPGNIMPDALHPKKVGYELWAKAMKPQITSYFEKKKMTKNERPTIRLWPKMPPGKTSNGPETEDFSKNNLRLSNITEPSITLYLRNPKKPSPFILISPGGGYNILSWHLEGEEIAKWLNSIGFSAGILKYRVPGNREGAFQDIQRAMGLVRQNIKKWNLIPNRIGALGFSAGGHLTARLASNYVDRAYHTIDAADELSCRPDFTVLAYPAYMGDKELNLQPEIKVDANTPPCFIVQTQDDVKYVASAVSYYTALFKQGISAELHLYQDGGHGYGIRPSAYPVTRWPELCRAWLLRLE